MRYLLCISPWTTGSCTTPVLRYVFRSFTSISSMKKNVSYKETITRNKMALRPPMRRIKWRLFWLMSISRILSVIICSISHESSLLRCLTWLLFRQSKFTVRHFSMKMTSSQQMLCPAQKATSKYSSE